MLNQQKYFKVSKLSIPRAIDIIESLLLIYRQDLSRSFTLQQILAVCHETMLNRGEFIEEDESRDGWGEFSGGGSRSGFSQGLKGWVQ